MQSALPFTLFTLLCPAPCPAPCNALSSSFLVVRHALLSALCAVRYAICLFLQCAVSYIVFCVAFMFSYPTLPCPALPCTALSCPALPCPALT